MQKRKLITILILLLSFFLIFFTESTNNNLSYIINLLITNIIPSLLPFMLIINFLMAFNCLDLLAYLLQKISIKLFNISGYSLIAILSSIIGGFPFSAIVVEQLISQKNISNEEGQKIINFIFFPSFSFLYSTLLFLNPSNKKIVLTTIVLIYIVSFLFLYIFKDGNYQINLIKKEELNKPISSFSISYNKIIKNCLQSLIYISMSIIIFSLFKGIIKNFIDGSLYHFIGGVIEFSSTAIELVLTDNLSIINTLIFTFIISFCGFSIFFQSYPYIKKAKLNFSKMLIWRFIIAITTTFFSYLIYLF